jgi:hypothetical protein
VRRVVPRVADAGAVPPGVADAGADAGAVRPQGVQAIREHLMGRSAFFESIRSHRPFIFPSESESEDVIVTRVSAARPSAWVQSVIPAAPVVPMVVSP